MKSLTGLRALPKPQPALACQKLIDRHFGSVRLGKERCLRPALECEITRSNYLGNPVFSAIAVLCERHRRAAFRDGYEVKLRAA
jgi:hypothetical protein